MSIPDETLTRWAAWPRPGTPGPWVWSGEDGGERSWEVLATEPGDDHFRVIAARPAWWDDLVADPEKRDAAFIALAPEMREAVDVLVAEVRRLNGPRCARCGDLLGDETITSDYDEAFVHFRCGPDALRGDA